MKTFKQKSLYAALAGVSALGATGAAQAVNVNPDGLGQVLIYPYYTARGIGPNAEAPYVSLLTVVNSTASAKAVKVRFIEGKASKEVLDFNLFLSAKDVWTAAVGQVAGTKGAGVGTFDKSCTVPPLPSNGDYQPFVNYAYALPSPDQVQDVTLDRTMEGYVEIIEMGTVIGGTATAKAVTHVSGTPPGCASLQPNSVDDDSDPVNLAIGSDLTTPSGGLFGDMSLINVLAGTDYTEDAVAIDNFRNFSVYNAPGSQHPNLADVSPPTSITIASSISGNFSVGGGTFSGAAVISGFFNTANGEKSIDAISALFMHDHVYNDYVLDSQTASGTDWVLTFPTKRFYYDDVTGDVINLFQSNLGTDGACDNISLTVYDREESHASGSAGFSPPKPGKSNQLCWESTVLTFNASQVLGSTNNRNLNVTYQNGWVDLLFPFVTGSGTHNLFAGNSFVIDLNGFATGAHVVYSGLPVIGFAVQSFVNGDLVENGTIVQSSYGGNFVHKTTRAIDVTALFSTPLAKSHAKTSKGKASK